MKKTLLILLLISSLSYSQNYISIKQDIKLAVISDDYGNKPFTFDLVIDYKEIVKDNSIFLLSYEYAGLKQDYHRLSIGGGYNFKIKVIELQPTFSTGIIYHKSLKLGYVDLGIDVFYNISSQTAIGVYNQFSFRTDIARFRDSNFISIKFRL